MNDTTPLFAFDADRLVAHVRTPDHASFSTLDAWDSCPGRWAAEKLLPREVAWNDPLRLGSIAHAAIELSMRAPDVDAPDWTDLCMRGVAHEREVNEARGWGDDPAPAIVMDDGKTATDLDWAKAAAMKLSGFRLSLPLRRTPTPAECEQRVETMVWDVPMAGAIDYRDRDGTVIDWKTGSVPRYRDGIRRHADQLRCYKAMLGTSGVDVARAYDWYVEHGVSATADLSMPAVADTGARMRAAWDGVLSDTSHDRYRLRPSGLCGWCPLARVCPSARVESDKAKAAAMRALDPTDPRVALPGVTVGGWRATGAPGVAGLPASAAPGVAGQTASGLTGVAGHGAGTAPGTHVASRKETDDMDALSMLFGGATPAPQPKPQPKTQDFSPDPWADPEAAKAALAAWGLEREETKPAPTPAPKAKTEPEPTPLKAREGKPYEPSLTGGTLNLAGYGFTQLMMTVGLASRLAGGDMDHARTITLAVIDAERDAARAVFGAAAPDGLLAWLDTSLSRDVDRLMRPLLEQSAPPEGEPAPLDVTLERIRDAGDTVRGLLALTRRLVA